MKKLRNHKRVLYILAIFSLLLQTSCEDFFNPTQETNITEDKLFDDWYEYRSTEMGLYAIQQDMAEQLLVLGELRGDLLKITESADADLVEIYNFDISKRNKYASPTNFFKLISACNNLINILETNHPEVLDKDAESTNYDRLYGEVLCMRAWAYFNAVRIYGKVPFIHESLTTIEEIDAYLESSSTYVDSVDIIYSIDGYFNDTIYNNEIELEKQFWDMELVVDYFTNDLEKNVKAVGVNHGINNDEDFWEVIVWSEFSMKTLLGLMNLTVGDLARAAYYFEEIVYLNSIDVENRFHLDKAFANGNWSNIVTGIDRSEHIYSIWFNKVNQQQNDFQRLFESRQPHDYMLKPTKKAVMGWETIWDDYRLNVNSNPTKTTLSKLFPGRPGDFYRGYGVSYAYVRSGENEIIPAEEIQEMLLLKKDGNMRSAELITEGADTVVWKYSLGKDVYAQDANLNLYRAAGVHLWLAEIYTWWKFERGNQVSTFRSNAIDIVNDGANYSKNADRDELGVRGRVGFGSTHDGIKLLNEIYVQDPFTNEVLGYINLQGNDVRQSKYLENEIIEERGRELAYEGERFYDLMRVAKRRGEPSYLAEKVSSTYPTGMRDRIYNLLLDENNWYINYFEE